MKLGKFGGFTNPITKEGMRALVIVLGAIILIAAIVYVVNFVKRKESTIVPMKTLEKVTVTPQPTSTTKIPTVTPFIKEEKLIASPSSTRKVQSPTGIPTSSLKEATVTPVPTR